MRIPDKCTTVPGTAAPFLALKRVRLFFFNHSQIITTMGSDKNSDMGLEDEEHDSNAHEILPAVSKVRFFAYIS
jgi:hypothetical protein